MRKAFEIKSAVLCVFLLVSILFLLSWFVGREIGMPETHVSGGAELPDEVDRHVPRYEELARYNELQIFQGLVISETAVDNAACYRLTNDGIPELNILVNEEETCATVIYQGNTVQFDILGVFPDAYAACFGLMDLNGDKTPEVYYFCHGTGTGINEPITSVIVDITTMKLIEIEPFLVTLANGLRYTLRAVEDDRATYEVTSGALEPTLGYSYIETDEDIGDAELLEGNYVSICANEGALEAVVGFTMSNAKPGTHLVYVYANFRFDELSGTFKIQAPYRIEAESPAT